jgi:hypothetical protein
MGPANAGPSFCIKGDSHMQGVFSDENVARYRKLASGTLTATERKTVIDALARDRKMNDESNKYRQSAADHFRKARKATTASEKKSETRTAKSYKTMADNEEWVDRERAKIVKREPERPE